MRPNRLCKLLLLIGLLFLSSDPSHAQSTPFVGFEPDGWHWWRGEDFLLLPNDALPGSQHRFFLVMAGDHADAWLSAWMGGGEILWQGTVTAGGTDWDVRVARSESYHGVIGSAQGWTFAAISPESQWLQDAPVYNSVLRGGP